MRAHSAVDSFELHAISFLYFLTALALMFAIREFGAWSVVKADVLLLINLLVLPITRLITDGATG